MDDRLYQPQRHEHELPAAKRQCLDRPNQYLTGEELGLFNFEELDFARYSSGNDGQNALEDGWTTDPPYGQDISAGAALPFETSQLSSEFCQDIYTEYSEASSSTDWQQQEFGFGGFNASTNNPFNLGPAATSSGYGANFGKETTPDPGSPKRELCFGMVNCPTDSLVYWY